MKMSCAVCGEPLRERRGHCPNCGTGYNFRDQKPEKKKNKKKRNKEDDSGIAQW